MFHNDISFSFRSQAGLLVRQTGSRNISRFRSRPNRCGLGKKSDSCRKDYRSRKIRSREWNGNRQRQTEGQRDRETERQRDKETQRQIGRETERQRDKETERQRDR